MVEISKQRFTFDKTTAATSHEKSPSKKLVALRDPPMSKKKISEEIMPCNTLKTRFKNHESVLDFCIFMMMHNGPDQGGKGK